MTVFAFFKGGGIDCFNVVDGVLNTAMYILMVAYNTVSFMTSEVNKHILAHSQKP